MSLPSLPDPAHDRMPPVPGNRYQHGQGTRHCAQERPCPINKCGCGQDVQAEIVTQVTQVVNPG